MTRRLTVAQERALRDLARLGPCLWEGEARGHRTIDGMIIRGDFLVLFVSLGFVDIDGEGYLHTVNDAGREWLAAQEKAR